jgi:exonuclease SbcD
LRILHTSDWHVGKVLKGQSRADDHKAALKALVDLAQAEQPDLVIVAGDLYDTATPAPESTAIVTRGLTALRRTEAEVVVVGGNHGRALDALRSWADAAGITLRGSIGKPEEHLIAGTTRDGEAWRLIALPFLSQRYAVRASEMFDLSAAEVTQSYAGYVANLVAHLAQGFGDDTVNLLTAHLTVIGATMGGGEREAHTIMGYAVPAAIFPSSIHYAALGHLHRAQAVPGPCPIRYSGEEENVSTACIVDVTTSTAARVREITLPVGTPLRTVRGTLEQLATLQTGEAWLRVYVNEPPRAGLREEVQEMLPKALEVRIDPKQLPSTGSRGEPARAGRSAGELFSDYLDQRGHADEATVTLFHRLHDEVMRS